MVGIVLAVVVLTLVLVSVAAVVRDVRRLHRRRRSLSDRPGAAGDVSAAGMTFGGGLGTH